MQDIPFIDAHVHLWDLVHLRYPWLMPPFSDDGPNGSVESIARTYLLSDYMDDAEGWNIAGMVHVDAGADPADALDETRWLQTMSERSGMPNGIVAYADLRLSDADRVLAAQAEHANVRGIRQIANWHADPQRTYNPTDMLTDPDWQRGFGSLSRYGLSFDLQAYPGQFAGFAKFLNTAPQTRVIVNHAGMPVPGEADVWLEGMKALSFIEGVSVKISGFGLVHRNWTTETIRPLVLRLVDLFGTDRIMIASDFPTDKLFATYDRCLSSYAEIISAFSEDEKRDMWARNANHIYRLGLNV